MMLTERIGLLCAAVGAEVMARKAKQDALQAAAIRAADKRPAKPRYKYNPGVEERCPVPDGANHQVVFRGGEIVTDDDPESWQWLHRGDGGDILFYRVIGEGA